MKHSPENSPERGSATIEFLAILLIFLVPLTYLAVTLAHVEAAGFATQSAARTYARILSRQTISPETHTIALHAAKLAYRDQGLDPAPAKITTICEGTCGPGRPQTVKIAYTVQVPLLGFEATTIEYTGKVHPDAYRK